MEHQILEELFVDYIIEKVGPNKDKEKIVKTLISIFESLIKDALEEENTNYIIKIFPFGSFPSKLYLYNSDLDLSVLFFPKNESIFEFKDPEFINKSLVKISKKLEQNKEISNISIIYADIKLIKCKMKGIPIDISISNYLGISKLYFISKLEKEILVKEERITLFKRSIILIKAWCSLESEIIGSNKSLLASYAVESLVMFLFNQNNEKIKTEIDAFVQFFELLSSIDFEKFVITIFGVISIEDMIKYIKNEDYENQIEIFYSKNKGYFDAKKIIDISKNVKKINEYDNNFSFKQEISNNEKGSKSYKNFLFKKMNIIDPLNAFNNLGKSVNFYSFHRIIKIIQSMNISTKNIQTIFRTDQFSENDLINSTNYLNVLMKCFSKTLSKIYSDIEMYMAIKETVNSSDLNLTINDLFSDSLLIEDVSTMIKMNYESSLNDKLIKEFNLKFKISKGLNFFEINTDENSNQNSNVKNNDHSIIISPDFSLFLNSDILKEFSNSLDYGNSSKKFKDYLSNNETISFINELLNN